MAGLSLCRGHTSASSRRVSESADTLAEHSRLIHCWTHLERAQQALVNTHHGACVVELAAVVWCTEQGHELSFTEELVSIFDDLMSTANQVHVVFLQESGHDIWAEGERDTAIVFTPACDILIGIRPEQIAQKTAVGDLRTLLVGSFRWVILRKATYIRWAHDPTYLLHGVEIRAQTTMHGEDLLVDDCGNGQAVEAIRKSLP